MTLLNYVTYEGVTAKQILDYLRQFLNAQGWTQKEYFTDRGWDASGWIAGTRDFLDMYSKGFGSFNIRARFAAGPDVSGGDDAFWFKIINPNNQEYSIGTSTHPVWQNSKLPDALEGLNSMGRSNYTATNTAGLISLPISLEKVWIVGDYRFLAMHFKISDDLVFSFAMGLPDLYVDFRSVWTKCHDFVCCWHGQKFNGYNSPEIWSTDPADLEGTGYLFERGGTYQYTGFYDNAQRNYGTFKCGTYRYDWDGTVNNDLIGHASMVHRLNYADNDRILLKQYYFYNNGGVYYILGESPGYIVNSAGLEIGSIITKGSKEYLIFPVFHRTQASLGVAYRIA